MNCPPEHVVMHVRDALASDGRVGELGLDVELDGGVVVVRGAISTSQRQAAVLLVATEVLRQLGCDAGVRDQTHVPAAAAPTGEAEAL